MGPHLIHDKSPWKWQKGNLHKNQWWMNNYATFFVGNIKKNHENKFKF